MEENVSSHEEFNAESDDATEYISDAFTTPDTAESLETDDEPIVIEREVRITFDPEADVITREERTVISGLDVGGIADESVDNINQGAGDLVGNERLEGEARQDVAGEAEGNLNQAFDDLAGNSGKIIKP